MKPLPEHGACFVCGSENPRSMGLTWYLQEDGGIYAQFTFNLTHQGPPGHVHGGASAAVLDEAMGAAVWRAGLQVVAARLEVDYRRPLPLEVTATIQACIYEKMAHKVFASAEILLPDGKVAVTGRGIYVSAPHLFEGTAFLAKQQPS